jgi:hypothetical protein
VNLFCVFDCYQTDVWSLGCLLYELAVLRSPFKADGLNIYSLFQKISQGDYQPISSEYSEELRNLSTLMMSTKSEDRPDISSICEIARTMRVQTTEQAKLKRQSSSGGVASTTSSASGSQQAEVPPDNDPERVGSAATVGSNDSLKVDPQMSKQATSRVVADFKSSRANNTGGSETEGRVSSNSIRGVSNTSREEKDIEYNLANGRQSSYSDKKYMDRDAPTIDYDLNENKGVTVGEIKSDKAVEPTYFKQFGPKVTATASSNYEEQPDRNFDGYTEGKSSMKSTSSKSKTNTNQKVASELMSANYNLAAIASVPSQPEVYKRIKGGAIQTQQQDTSSHTYNNSNSKINQKSKTSGKSQRSAFPSVGDQASTSERAPAGAVLDDDEALSGFDDLQADNLSRALAKEKENPVLYNKYLYYHFSTDYCITVI